MLQLLLSPTFGKILFDQAVNNTRIVISPSNIKRLDAEDRRHKAEHDNYQKPRLLLYTYYYNTHLSVGN